MSARSELVDRLFRYFDKNLDENIKGQIPSGVLTNILHCVADFYMKEKEDMVRQIAMDLTRPKVRTGFEFSEEPTDTSFMDELKKL